MGEVGFFSNHALSNSKITVNFVFRESLSGHFSKSRFVRLDLFGSQAPLEGTRELEIKAKFSIFTGEIHIDHDARVTLKSFSLFF